MVRALWHLTAVVVLSVLTMLALPGNGSALRSVLIVLTPTGPSASVMTIPAGLYPVWENHDTVAHSIVVASGQCTLQLAPGGFGECSDPAMQFAGTFPYTVDGTIQAAVVVVPEGRAIHLAGNTHTIERGASLKLHGKLDVALLSPPGQPAPQPVTVLTRPDRYHAFRPFRIVTATAKGWHLLWKLRVRPRAKTIYIAEANFQPEGGQYWNRAWSKSFRVAVRPR
jgi:hypothetical protein